MWFNYYQNQSVYLHAETHLTAYIKPPSSLFHQAFTVTRGIMSNNVLSFSVGYNPINKSNTFTSGDCITGQITLELAKDCKIDSLCVKLKGKAEVKWTESYGNTVVTYHNKEKYFSIKQVIIEAGKGATYVIQL